MQVKESVDSGVYVKDLTAVVVKNVSEINNVLDQVRRPLTSSARQDRRAACCLSGTPPRYSQTAGRA